MILLSRNACRSARLVSSDRKRSSSSSAYESLPSWFKNYLTFRSFSRFTELPSRAQRFDTPPHQFTAAIIAPRSMAGLSLLPANWWTALGATALVSAPLRNWFHVWIHLTPYLLLINFWQECPGWGDQASSLLESELKASRWNSCFALILHNFKINEISITPHILL